MDRRACYFGAGTLFVDGGVGAVSDFSQPTSTRETATVRSAISLIIWFCYYYGPLVVKPAVVRNLLNDPFLPRINFPAKAE
jgi:hypothetical protein